MKRYFQISCHALVISAFFAVALTGRLDFPSIVLFTLGVSGSLYRTVRGMPPLVSARGAFYLSCVYIGFFLLDSAFISRSFIPATIHLVLFLELAKLYQHKDDKDYLYLILLAFLKVLAASSLTINMSFAAALLLFLIALVSTLMSFDMYRSERDTKVDTQSGAGSLGGMSVWAAIWIIVTGAGLFFIIPRIGVGYFSQADSPSLLLSGFTETVQLGDIGQVKLSSAVVMHAKRLSGPAFAILKWRGISLDRFDGGSWHKSDRSRLQVRPSDDNQFSIGMVQDAGAQVQYQVLLEPLATNTLFGPYQIRSVSGRLQGLEMDNDDSIYMRFQSLRRIQYQVLSEVPRNALAAGNTSDNDEPVPPSVPATYLQLPEGLDPRVAQLAQEITSRASTFREKAVSVEAYLKRNYRYTLDLDWAPGDQPVTTFLFSAKSGHCEYFASSMAILLRSIGIPTRIVNGFLMGEYNPVGDDYIVRQSDAHSWVEVYIPGPGWTEFDPTPPDSSQREITFATQIAHYIDAAELFWNTYVLIYDTGAQSQLFRSAQDGVQSFQSALRDRSDNWMVTGQELSDSFARTIGRLVDTVWFWLAATTLLAAGGGWKYRRFLRTELQIRRLRRGSGAVDDQVIEQMFYRAAHLAERKAGRRGAAQTWREWTSGLEDPNRKSLLIRAVDVFERSRYGRQTASPADFAVLERTIRELRGT